MGPGKQKDHEGKLEQDGERESESLSDLLSKPSDPGLPEKLVSGHFLWSQWSLLGLLPAQVLGSKTVSVHTDEQSEEQCVLLAWCNPCGPAVTNASGSCP